MDNFKDEINGLLDDYENNIPGWIREYNRLIGRVANLYRLYNVLQINGHEFGQASLSVLVILLQQKGTMSQLQLSKMLPVSKQRVAMSINYLEKSGFVYRQSTSKDKRRKKIFLTHEGILFLKNVMPIKFNYYTKLMQLIDKQEAEHQSVRLKEILAGLEKGLKKKKHARYKSDSDNLDNLL